MKIKVQWTNNSSELYEIQRRANGDWAIVKTFNNGDKPYFVIAEGRTFWATISQLKYQNYQNNRLPFSIHFWNEQDIVSWQATR